MRSASPRSRSEAITITFDAPSRSSSPGTVSAASPEPKHTRWGWLSWTKRTLIRWPPGPAATTSPRPAHPPDPPAGASPASRCACPGGPRWGHPPPPPAARAPPRPRRQAHPPPADVLVRADHDGAILRDLAQPGPVEVEVGDLPPGPDHHRLEPDAQQIGRAH